MRGHADRRGPTVGEIAHYLGLRHNSTVGLVDRAASAGLITRRSDEDDRRVVRVRLTSAGRHALGSLASQHRDEFTRLESIARAIEKSIARATSKSSVNHRRASDGQRH